MFFFFFVKASDNHFVDVYLQGGILESGSVNHQPEPDTTCKTSQVCGHAGAPKKVQCRSKHRHSTQRGGGSRKADHKNTTAQKRKSNNEARTMRTSRTSNHEAHDRTTMYKHAK